MSHFSFRLVCRIVSIFIFFAILTNWKFFLLLLNPEIRDHYLGHALFAMSILLLNIPVAIGLYNDHHWGFILAYLTIPFNTIVLNICYIPFLPSAFPIGWEREVTLIANSFVMIIILILHGITIHRRFHLNKHHQVI